MPLGQTQTAAAETRLRRMPGQTQTAAAATRLRRMPGQTQTLHQRMQTWLAPTLQQGGQTM